MCKHKSCPIRISRIHPDLSSPLLYGQLTDGKSQSCALYVLVQFFKSLKSRNCMRNWMISSLSRTISASSSIKRRTTIELAVDLVLTGFGISGCLERMVASRTRPSCLSANAMPMRFAAALTMVATWKKKWCLPNWRRIRHLPAAHQPLCQFRMAFLLLATARPSSCRTSSI